MKDGSTANYIFPASFRGHPELYSECGYQRDKFKAWTIERICELSRAIAKNEYPDDETLAIYLAAMVAEPRRNVVTEVTNRLVMGDRNLQSQQALHDNGQMPMTRGGSITGSADLSLDPLRRGSNKASGQVTDREIAMAKTYYEQATGKNLTAVIEEKKETADTKKHIKDTLRSRFADLSK